MAIKCYTISSVKALKELPNLDVAQFTLNSRVYPAKRKTVELLREMRHTHNTKLIIHQDFIYIISRFGMMKDYVQCDIINDIINMMDYANTEDSLIHGLVMHTDWPLKKECYSPSVNLTAITDSYSSSIWDLEKVTRCVEAGLENLLEDAICEFYHMFKAKYNKTIPFKIYLENTTKVPNLPLVHKPGSVQSLVNILTKNPQLQELFGICIDTEHDFAVTGDYDYSNIPTELSKIVHLNTIPDSVKPGSMRDRHSETTIFECSVNKPETYLSIMEELQTSNTLFVREVHEETMFRELKQIEEWEQVNRQTN